MYKLKHTGSLLIVVLLAMLMTSCRALRHSLSDQPARVNRAVVERPQTSHVSRDVVTVVDTVYTTRAKERAKDPSETLADGGHRTDVMALMAADSLLTLQKAAKQAGKVSQGSRVGNKRSGSVSPAQVNGGKGTSTAATQTYPRGATQARANAGAHARTGSASQSSAAQSSSTGGANGTAASDSSDGGSAPDADADGDAEAEAEGAAAGDSVTEAAVDTIPIESMHDFFGNDSAEDASVVETTQTDEDNPFIMKLLLIALLLLLAIFIAYIIYTRKQVEKLKEHERQQLFDLRMKHSQDADRREGMKSVAQGKAERALIDLKHEKEVALSEKEAALSEKEAALSEKEAALSEKEAAENAKTAAENAKAAAENAKAAAETAKAAAESAKNAALSEKMIAEKAKDEAIAAQQEALTARNAALASLSAREADLAAKEAELNAQKDALAAKDAELTAANAEISAQKDALAAREAELSALNAELAAARDEIAAALAAAAATAAAEPAPPAEPAEAPAAEAAQTNEDRTAAINTMRKMIMRKIESAQAIVDLKGLKKGEVLTEDELKDIASFLENVDNKFVSRFSAKFPDLTRKDVELMMLLRLRLPSKNLASVYGINEKSIKQKLFVYKTKVGLETDPMSLRDFIENF